MWPFQIFFSIESVANGAFGSCNENCPHFRKAVSSFTRSILQMPMIDYFSFILENEYRMYFHFGVKYANLSESMDMIKQWFQFQFAEDWNNVLQVWFNVLTSKVDKKKTIWLIGPANSGKSFVSESLCLLFLLVGQVHNTTDGGQFPFQDLINTRIHYFNELVIGDNEKPWLNILAGEPLKVQVKYRL